MYMKFVLLRKTKKTNLQTYFHLSSLNHLKYAHVLYNAENKKMSAKVPILRTMTVLCPSRSY